MENLGKRLLLILVAVGAFLCVRQGLHVFQEHTTAAQVSESADQLKSDAAKHNPGVPAALAIQREGIAKADEMMKNAPDDRTRRQNAAGTFYGFYFVNTRSRVDYCKEQGSDIQPFVTIFQGNHVNELAAARAILAEIGTDEETLYTQIKPQLRDLLNTDMKFIADAGKTDAKGACELIIARADVLAGQMQLSKVQPMVERVLMAGK
jgi:hypothetical protein